MDWRSLQLLKENLGNVGEGVTSYISGRREEQRRQEQADLLKPFLKKTPAPGVAAGTPNPTTGQPMAEASGEPQYDPNMVRMAFPATNYNAFDTLRGLQQMKREGLPKHHLLTQPKTGEITDVQEDPNTGTLTPSQHPIIEGIDPAKQYDWRGKMGQDGKYVTTTVGTTPMIVLEQFDKNTGMPTGSTKPGAIPGAALMGQGQLDEATLEREGKKFYATGEMPALGMGSGAVRQQIMKRASDVAKRMGETDPQATRAAYQAHLGAFKSLQTRSALIAAYEGQARKNLDVAEEMGQKYIRTGAPLVNKAQNWLAENVNNNPNYTAFENAIYTAAREYAKVTTTINGQSLTDSATHEAEKLINASQSPEQFRAAVQVMRRDMANTILSQHEELANQQNFIKQLTNPGGGGAQGGRIRVRSKATGKTGTVSEGAFDPAKYERIQ